MSEHSLINALSDIADDKIADALGVYERKRHQRSIFFRIAAVAATIAILLTVSLWPQKAEDDRTITSPGFLKVYAYDLSSGTPIEQQEGVDLADRLIESPSAWWLGMGSYYGLPIKIKIADDKFADKKITFDITTAYGNFYGDIKSDKYKKNPEDTVAKLSDAELGSCFTIENGETIFWEDRKIDKEAISQGLLPEQFLEKLGNIIYVDIIVKADNNIAGYAVVAINYHGGVYTAAVREIVSYPNDNGDLQEVTEAYVRQEIANCKAVQ